MTYVFATFSKTGRLQYISHLDLQRAVTRLLLRTGLPIGFSEGFNPHPKLNFAQPLSIFQESLCEVMEFRLDGTDGLTEASVLDALRRCAPPELCFSAVQFSERKLPTCRAARYELTYRTALTAEQLQELLRGEMPVLKKTKTKEVTLDIAPLIRDAEVAPAEGGLRLSCTLPCGDGYLNPHFIAVFLGERAEECRVLRTKLFF